MSYIEINQQVTVNETDTRDLYKVQINLTASHDVRIDKVILEVVQKASGNMNYHKEVLKLFTPIDTEILLKKNQVKSIEVDVLLETKMGTYKGVNFNLDFYVKAKTYISPKDQKEIKPSVRQAYRSVYHGRKFYKTKVTFKKLRPTKHLAIREGDYVLNVATDYLSGVLALGSVILLGILFWGIGTGELGPFLVFFSFVVWFLFKKTLSKIIFHEIYVSLSHSENGFDVSLKPNKNYVPTKGLIGYKLVENVKDTRGSSDTNHIENIWQGRPHEKGTSDRDFQFSFPTKKNIPSLEFGDVQIQHLLYIKSESFFGLKLEYEGEIQVYLTDQSN